MIDLRRGAGAVLLAPLALMLAACVSAPQAIAPIPQADAPRFDPFTFFAGNSAGTGVLAKVRAADTPVQVTSSGRIVTEGLREAAWAAPPRRVLVVDQTIREGEKPARTRQWRLYEVAPDRYEGTLSDAISPVTARVQGNQLVVEFTIKGSFKVRQELTLSPDGQRAHNVTRISQLGVTAAVLVEDIVRE
jgi:hypothetical protein